MRCPWSCLNFYSKDAHLSVKINGRARRHPNAACFCNVAKSLIVCVFLYLIGRQLSFVVFSGKKMGGSFTYTATSMQDFGRVHCRAANEVGWQEEPCVFEIRPRGEDYHYTRILKKPCSDQNSIEQNEKSFLWIARVIL